MAPEGAREEPDREHPRRAARRTATACEVGVERREHRADPRRDATDVAPHRERLDPYEDESERVHDAEHREDEVRAADREQVGEAAGAKGNVVVVREIVFAEDERAGERRRRRRERRVDASTRDRPCAIDDRAGSLL